MRRPTKNPVAAGLREIPLSAVVNGAGFILLRAAAAALSGELNLARQYTVLALREIDARRGGHGGVYNEG